MKTGKSANAIEIKNIYKTYFTEGGAVEVLKGVDMTVVDGEFVAIMGPSGSGKSTLMHIIGALDIPTSGNYILDGEDVSQLTDDELADVRNQKIGFVFQAFNLLSRTTVLDNVRLPGMYGGLSIAERTRRALESIAAVGLADRANHLSNQLSGGQQQRVAIARSLTMSPQIILADEPTGNLPPDQTDDIMSLFKSLNKKGHTIVVITHEPAVAAYADRVFHLKNGVIDHIEIHQQYDQKIESELEEKVTVSKSKSKSKKKKNR